MSDANVTVITPFGEPLLREHMQAWTVWVNVYQTGVGEAWDDKRGAQRWERTALYRIKITPKVKP
jgi:hypothetical protein